VEGYRTGSLSACQARALPALTRYEFDGFLKERDVWEHAFSSDGMEFDRETMAWLEARQAIAPQPDRIR
jgi:hypothetical protein